MEIREYSHYQEEEILSLYRSVGWTAYIEAPELLRAGFEHSLLTLAAYEGSQLLGLLRAVGDGCCIVYVQDILVFPAHQRKGVGSALLKAVLEHFSTVRQIVLVTDNTPKTVAFYRSAGLVPLEELGCCGFTKP